jgi:hypothetical protein
MKQGTIFAELRSADMLSHSFQPVSVAQSTDTMSITSVKQAPAFLLSEPRQLPV